MGNRSNNTATDQQAMGNPPRNNGTIRDNRPRNQIRGTARELCFKCNQPSLGSGMPIVTSGQDTSNLAEKRIRLITKIGRENIIGSPNFMTELNRQEKYCNMERITEKDEA
ncbi:hypothetical protein EVAR_64381_1 [Eumeta japonica]|uniref:Uncharacterized protein n=1 Tax=Eumeta variegata TaxID=151549 RepID=A0A4C1SF39_EUMVA|nr:hypothetical protein EVAR_64381_1 [Eumeta japonica]